MPQKCTNMSQNRLKFPFRPAIMDRRSSESYGIPSGFRGSASVLKQAIVRKKETVILQDREAKGVWIWEVFYAKHGAELVIG
jgi:hypothetical protein